MGYDYEIFNKNTSDFIAGFNVGDDSRYGKPFDDEIALQEFREYWRCHRGAFQLRVNCDLPTEKGARL